MEDEISYLPPNDDKCKGAYKMNQYNPLATFGNTLGASPDISLPAYIVDLISRPFMTGKRIEAQKVLAMAMLESRDKAKSDILSTIRYLAKIGKLDQDQFNSLLTLYLQACTGTP